jgi:hypothetical protein
MWQGRMQVEEEDIIYFDRNNSCINFIYHSEFFYENGNRTIVVNYVQLLQPSKIGIEQLCSTF